MIYDLVNVDSHVYSVYKEDGKTARIGYPVQDTISTDITKKYLTMWACFKEYNKSNSVITKETLDEYIEISLYCGDFAYAKIPSSAFQTKVGVSGTIKTLVDSEKKMLKSDYGIYDITCLPSIFGESKLHFDPKKHVFIILEKNEFDEKIKENIEEVIKTERPVLVFFKEKQRLYDFHKIYTANQKTAVDINIITEELNLTELDSCIKKATRPGEITFVTRHFDTGTDFKCRDKKINDAGGPVLISTFLPDSDSEQKQLQGRTARYGKPGSFLMLLWADDLKKFVENTSTTMKEISEKENRYELLKQYRDTFFKNHPSIDPKKVQEVNEKHGKTVDVYKLLRGSGINYAGLNKFVTEQNISPSFNRTSYTKVVFDSTGSMRDLFEPMKKIIYSTFERTHEILKNNKISTGAVNIDLITYTNYSSGKEKIIRRSQGSDQEASKLFLDNLEVDGGEGNEAIECALHTINKDHESHPVSQVILIGDAGANTPAEVIAKRKKYENVEKDYWLAYKNVEHYTVELEKIKTSKIPIYPFFVHKDAKKDFDYIAQQTTKEKESRELDVNSSQAVDDLTDTLSKNILEEIGGEEKGEELVGQYNMRFGWRKK